MFKERKKRGIDKLISEYKRRLQILKIRRAKFGLNTPPEILTEIEDIERAIDELQAESSIALSHPVFYGIIKDPDLLGKINMLSHEVKDEINNIIDSLQSNPRPSGHKPTAIAPEIINFEVGTKPKYNLLYKIDETRKVIAVLRLDSTYFS